MQVSGKQVVLLNEFEPNRGFYKWWGVEEDVRTLAELFPNSYQIAIFACCRQIYDPTRDSGCFGGTKQEAIEQFNQIEESKNEE